jgi:hypothetical protein
VGGGVDDHNIARQQVHSIRFDHGIQGKRRTGLSLAPTAVTAVNEKRFRDHAVAHMTAGASTIVERVHGARVAHAGYSVLLG